MEDETNHNSKKTIVVIVILLLVSVLVVFLTNYFRDKESLADRLVNMGGRYYEQVFFPSLDGTESPKKFEGVGIVINVDSLVSKFDQKEQDKVNKQLKEHNCSKGVIVIYPKSPYKQVDYSINIEMECD